MGRKLPLRARYISRRAIDCRLAMTSNGGPGNAPGMALRRSRFSPAVAGRRRGLRGALAGDAGGRRVRLSAHRLAVHRRNADDAAHAADGAVRRPRRRLGRAARAAHRADHRRHFDAADLAGPGAARLERRARSVACRARQLCQRHCLDDRQPGPPHDDRRGRRTGADERGDVARCRRQQCEPHARPDPRRRAARDVRDRRRLCGQRRLLPRRARRCDADPSSQQRAAHRRREHPRAHDRRVHARPARPAAGRNPGRHRHLQHLRLAVHQHDPGDRPGQSGSRRRRHRPSRQHGRGRRVLRRRRDRALGQAGDIRPPLCRGRLRLTC